MKEHRDEMKMLDQRIASLEADLATCSAGVSAAYADPARCISLSLCTRPDLNVAGKLSG